MTTSRSKISSSIIAVLLVIALIARFFFHNSSSKHSEKNRPDEKTSTTQAANPPVNDDGLNRNESHLILTRHARCRMECRHITQDEIKQILHDGNINYNKSELHAERGPKYALEGYLPDHQHLRVIFAPEPNAMVVVTCIDLDTEWQCPSCN